MTTSYLLQDARGAFLPGERREGPPSRENRDRESRRSEVLDRMSCHCQAGVAAHGREQQRFVQQSAGAPQQRADGESDVRERRPWQLRGTQRRGRTKREARRVSTSQRL